MRILLVEDERELAASVARALTTAGYEVVLAHDGEDAAEQVEATVFDLVLLDLMLPGRDGFSVLAGLRRSRPSTPVLMLTAREDVSSRVRGLDAGADDYLAKPFDLREVLARIRALLRRTAGDRTAVLRLADLELDPSTMIVQRGGRRVNLTAREYQLIELLLRNRNRVLSREVIFDHIWSSGRAGTLKVVDVYMTYLRSKIDRQYHPRLLHSVRGVGYVMRVDEDDHEP